MIAPLLVVLVFAILVALWGGLVHIRRPAPRRPRLWLQTPRERS